MDQVWLHVGNGGTVQVIRCFLKYIYSIRKEVS